MNELLRDVSRSFYLTLRVLPQKVRHPIGLAYLLARATDTVADTEIVPVGERLEVLRAMRGQLGEKAAPNFDLSRYTAHQGTPAERSLLLHLPDLWVQLNQLPESDQRLIRKVAQTIASGQELDLERFRDAGANRIVALPTAAELHEYTYLVAGCVGEFWTHLCRLHLFPNESINMEDLLRDGARFGQGLQLVNILRDLPADLRAGRCYLPHSELSQAGLEPRDLLNSSSEPLLRRVYDPWLQTARDHLKAGWTYTNALPWRCYRLRLACAWPILIGFETLQKLDRENVLEAGRRIKASRKQVWKLMLRSILACPCRGAWRNLVGFQAPRP